MIAFLKGRLADVYKRQGVGSGSGSGVGSGSGSIGAAATDTVRDAWE